MPIIVDRRTGKVISQPEITEKEREELLEAIIHKWIEKNPDEFRKLARGESEKISTGGSKD